MQLHLQLLGFPQITWQGEAVSGFASNKVRALLIYLAVTERTHSRDMLAELLWADTPASARVNLRKALSNLRKLNGVTLSSTSVNTVALDLQHCWTDVNEFDQLLTGSSTPDLDALRRAVELYQDDFLAGFNISLSYEFESWALGEQARLRGQMVEALRSLSVEEERLGNLGEATVVMRRLLAMEPWREEAHRRVMELLARFGDRGAALKQYALCCQALMDELGDDTVSDATEDLYKRILNHEIEISPPIAQGEGDGEVQVNELRLPSERIPDPGPLPLGSIMPLGRNPLFVGREQNLRSLADAVNAGDATAVSQVRTAATTGLGGIGKTQLACEFVHRYGRFFSGGVFWLSFDNEDSIPAEIASCGGVGALDLRSDFGQRSLADQVNLVQAAWRDSIPRLLIFDNCEQLELLTRWRPTSGGCRILITSRRGDWEPALGVKMLALDVLSRAESLLLLRSHSPDAEDETLYAIAEELGDLPLALHLAGSHLYRYPHIAPSSYLEQLRDPQLLQHPSMQGEGFSPTGHVQHVGRTFALSYDRLDPQDEIDAQALKLLVHAAHFAPGEPIWYRLLLRTLGLDLDNPGDAIKADAAFARLIELGIIEQEANDTLHMHRLVARFVRDVARDQVEATQKAVEAIIFAETAKMNKQVQPLPLLDWQLHLRSVADIAKVRADEEGARLCSELGKHLWQIGDFDGALLYTEKALSIREEVLGAQHLDVAESLTLVGRVYRALGKSADTKPYFERALEIRLQQLGENHEHTAESRENLGRYFHEMGMFDESYDYLRQALATYQRTLGDEHELTAECHNNLAYCLYSMGDRTGALLHLERAAESNEKVLGAAHPHVAVNYHNIGAILYAIGKPEEARSFTERALAIRREVYGDDHPDTAISLERLGLILCDMGHMAEATTHVTQALTFYIRSLGEEHITTANCHSSMATVLQRQGKIDLAIAQQEQAYRVCRNLFGPDHEWTKNKLDYLNELRALTA